MNLKVKSIEISQGEFKIIPPDPFGGTDPIEQKGVEGEAQLSQLLVKCDFFLKGKNDQIIARGSVTNIPQADNHVLLSEDTLQTFRSFFSLLEQDVANALEEENAKEEKEEQPKSVARILGGRISRQS